MGLCERDDVLLGSIVGGLFFFGTDKKPSAT